MNVPSSAAAARAGAAPPVPPVASPRRRVSAAASASGIVAAGLLWTGFGVVVWWWADAAMAVDFATAASAEVALGRLAGLSSAYLMLVQVVLMARVPPLERAYGQDVLAGVHRLVGFTSVWLMLLHLGLTVDGYAAQARAGLTAESLLMLTEMPGMVLAALATGFVLLVVVTSLAAVRRKLRYASWHLVHLYAYLGIGLALPHQLWTGRDLVSSPGARWFWWSCYLAATGCLLVWRVAVPIGLNVRHRLRVHEVYHEAPDVVSVVVVGRHLGELRARAGQFFIWRFLSGPGRTRGHPYSLSAMPDGRTLRITVKALGEDSRRLRTMAPGTRVLVEGPYGRMHAGTCIRDRAVLLAAGIGITPLRALMEDLAQTVDVTLIYRARDEDDLMLRREIEEVAARLGVRVLYLLGRRRPGPPSFQPEGRRLSDARALRSLVPDIAEREVYLCGSPEWMAAARRAAVQAGVPARRVHEEVFAW